MRPKATARRLAGRLANLGWSRDDAHELGAIRDCEWQELLEEVGLHATPLDCADAVDLLRADEPL